eukprot:SAG31_NODE_28380_length_411_cov_0.644231_2_plen_20_part_01
MHALADTVQEAIADFVGAIA